MRILTAVSLTPLLCVLPALLGAGSVPESPGPLPNLIVETVLVTDESGFEISPTAGEPFWIRLDFRYTEPGCGSYTIERTVNSFTETSQPLNWGCGESGITQWSHISGSWVLHTAGTYDVTVGLDSGGTIFEASESDNELTVQIVVDGSVTPEWALVEADAGRNLLGDGTDVVVGLMGGAVEYAHPWLDGDDSLGRPRLLAASQNADGLGGIPLNANHATAVMGLIASRGENPGDLTGMVPDARYVAAEFINWENVPGLSVLHTFDAAGFVVDNGAEVINMSWSRFLDPIEARVGEGALTNLMVDYLAYGRNIICVPAVNQIPSVTQPAAPAAARNAITVGGLDTSLSRAWVQQNHGPTLDGRSKPDLLGNNAENALSIRSGWRDGHPVGVDNVGTSFATPFVTGAVAQLLDYGKSNGESTDHRVIKAVVMNSGAKALDSDGSAWDNAGVQPLDNEQGTGILNMVRAHTVYAAGQQAGPRISPRGYDFATISGTTSDPYPGGRAIYELGLLTDSATRLDATLVWDRHTYWDDANSNGRIDAPDDFYTLPSDAQDNLELVLYRNGTEVASSRSTVDTVEHLSVSGLQPGVYELHVERIDVASSGDGEDFALAWLADGSWTQAFTRASYSPYGAGCNGSAGVPVLEGVPGKLPWVGGQLQARITGLTPELSFDTAFMIFGFSRTQWGPLSLPFDISVFGFWDCVAYTSVDAAFPLIKFLGSAVWTLDIPNSPAFIGVQFYNQGFILDPGANPSGGALTNGMAAVVGG